MYLACLPPPSAADLFLPAMPTLSQQVLTDGPRQVPYSYRNLHR
jgi:hypothetical protein